MTRLAELRKEKGMSQQELADKSGVVRSHISFVEVGKKRLGIAAASKIAPVLGCTVTELLKEFWEV